MLRVPSGHWPPPEEKQRLSACRAWWHMLIVGLIMPTLLENAAMLPPLCLHPDGLVAIVSAQPSYAKESCAYAFQAGHKVAFPSRGLKAW